MARRTTVGSVTGALVDTMEVVSNVAGIITDTVGNLRTMNEGLGYKAIAFRENAKLDSQIELGKMKSDKTLQATAELAQKKAEIKRMLSTDKEMLEAWDECKTEVESWFN